ncbi:MAG: hypothetical protein M1480_12550 [Bacteroidetes bacterium]|nr:hypothetical protein [Bacteroidota bacterium]
MTKAKVNIFIFCLFFLTEANLNAQNYLTKQFDYAKKLFNNEQYFDAITEFKRLLFFDEEGTYKFEANRFIGLSYKEGAKFSDAIFYFTLAEMNAKNDDELFESKMDIIRSNILRRTTSHAIELLDLLETDKRFSQRIKEIYYWKGWAYLFSDKWDDAANYFSQTDSNKTLSTFCKEVDKNKYSSSVAELLSIFIPGSGQIYTGHYLSGLLSLSWNLLWGYVTINAFIANRVFDGLAVGNFLWLRFYNGNLQNAKNFAEEENLKIVNQALNYLQFGYNGTKP